VSDDLPSGISEILQYLAQMARGYGNRLKWNEVAKLKADLMNAPTRWQGVSVSETESVNVNEAPVLGFYRVVASVFWGGLIQELAGIWGGSGGLVTKRSGWAA
jgi:hypothetical protein